MEAKTTNDVENIILSLDDHIAVTKARGLEVAARLLAMAKLELQIATHQISTSEFQEFCSALEDGIDAENGRAAKSRSSTASVMEFGARKRRGGV
jgi:hypothetical protein